MCGKVKEYGGMKPRKQLEREVMQLRTMLDKNCRRKLGSYRLAFPIHGWHSFKRDKTWCEHCGNVFDGEQPMMAVQVEQAVRCPHCGRMIQLSRADKWTKQAKYEAIERAYVTTIDDWTVIRVFYIERRVQMGERERYDVNEIWQSWTNNDGREVILTKCYARSPFYFNWYFDSPWKIGHHKGGGSGYFYLNDVYDATCLAYGEIEVSKMLQRNGWKNDKRLYDRLDVVRLWQLLLTEPMVEEMVKTGQYQVVRYVVDQSGYNGIAKLARYIHALRICNRNGYVVEDARTWFDHMDLLQRCGKDTHNAKYVCPQSLEEEHLRLVEKVHRIEARRKLQEQIEQIQRSDVRYRQVRGMFFGCSFGNDNITVRVLNSVGQFLEEGTVMQHCVFTNEYYDDVRHPGSLILSARDKQGNRIETVEVDIDSWHVVQSRGYKNNTTAQHDAIVKLVNDNMNLLRQAATRKAV
jgi:DNA-directed RNA polymerase subunit RPC12/RpoP